MSKSSINRRSLLAAFGMATASLVMTTPISARAQQASMKIGIIGAGRIGSTFAEQWVKAGHSVMLSSRHPEELSPLVRRLGRRAQAGSVAQALRYSNVIFLAVPYSAYGQIGKDYRALLKGRIVIDAGNVFWYREGPLTTARTMREGVGMTSAQLLPGARIVRAFNAVDVEVFQAQAHRRPPRMAVPIASDDRHGLAVTSQLARDAGFDPVVIGGLNQAHKFLYGGPLSKIDVTAQEMRRRAAALGR